MSVVGPRPALPNEVATYNDYQRQRLLVKPGMTCYWQTRRNRDSITFDEWVDLDLWEIEYSLREYTRNGVKSSPNGLVGVIKKCDGGYGWIKTVTRNADKCRTASFDKSLLYPIIVGNRCNQDPKEYACNKCRSIHWLNGSYMALVEEEKFLEDPRRFIDNAFEKHQKIWNYDLCKTR